VVAAEERDLAAALVEPRNSARNAVQRRSHELILTSIATAPAAARHTKPDARNITSRITTCLKWSE
jgi:hypothetical protein